MCGRTIPFTIRTGRFCGTGETNTKGFAFLYEREGHVWVNVKCSPEWLLFWRDTYAAVRPAYHMNKSHWNTIVLDGTVPPEDIQTMLLESWQLTKPKEKRRDPPC